MKKLLLKFMENIKQKQVPENAILFPEKKN